MQSDRNSFCGDVILDSFNMTYRDEGPNLLNKLWKANLLGPLLWRFLILRLIEENVYLKDTAYNNKEPINWGFSATSVILIIFR